ncbi:MAG: hypothetical protein HY556_09510 [Euryarchaeota archaeon]|nr:hypothetical protein [Euryarchaeota archaeon]
MAVAFLLVMAAVVYKAGPRRGVNRVLALTLFVEAILISACDDGISIFLTDPRDYYGSQVIHSITHLALPFLYLVFIGAAIDTRLVRPLRHPAAPVIIVSLLFVAQVLRFVYRDQVIVGLDRPWFATGGFVPGPGFALILQFSAIVSLFGLVVTVDAWRRAASEAAKRRARAYAIAFAARDLYWAVLLLLVLPFGDPYHDVFWGIVFTQSMPLASIVFVSLLGYGILKTQLFEIDLKIKWTIRRGTVVGAFLLVFLTVAEVVQILVSDAFGIAAGLAAVGSLFFVRQRLQKAADGLADTVMPSVGENEEYPTSRKADVYRATVEEILGDRAVTEKERSILNRLREKLELGDETAAAIEREALSARGVA